MGIVFDEIVGNVEPSTGAQQPPPEEPEPSASADRGAPDEDALARWMRRQGWLAARRRAD